MVFTTVDRLKDRFFWTQTSPYDLISFSTNESISRGDWVLVTDRCHPPSPRRREENRESKCVDIQAQTEQTDFCRADIQSKAQPIAAKVKKKRWLG